MELKELIAMPSVSGSEDCYTRETEKLFLRCCDRAFSDSVGNVFGIKKTGSGKTKILIDAHSDIIGLIVTKINDDGLLSFACVGGVDTRILPSIKVVIHGKENIKGVIGVPPPHLLKEGADKPYKAEDLTIDTGLTKEQLSGIVEIGDLISFDSEYTELINGKIAARGLDNKIGVYCALKAVENTVRDNTEIIIAATCGEEIGLNGARAAADIADCDLCIVIDVTHGTTPDSSEDITFELGKGPAIALGPGLSKKHTNKLIEYAKANNIPFSYEVTNGHSGTNSTAYELAGAGLSCVIVSLPLRYMHTAYEVADMKDAEKLISLVSGFINEYEEV